MSPHVEKVTHLCLKFMTFDPNYNYDEDEEEDSMDVEEGLDEGLCVPAIPCCGSSAAGFDMSTLYSLCSSDSV